MLSIEQCRELIPDSANYSDEQILEIRDSLYETAQLAFDVHLEEKKKAT